MSLTGVYGPDFSQRRTNDYVADMQFAADVVYNGPTRMNLGSPAAADADGILDGQSIATATSVTTLADAYTIENMGRYGRNVVVVSDGAATSTVTVRGADYLGQPVTETLTLNGTTTVEGKKAFKFITEVEFTATASRTIDLGWGDVLGIPYALIKSDTELVDNSIPSAGTVTAAVETDPQTATTGDPRGTWKPHASYLPDGSREFELIGLLRLGNLHGVAHYNA